MKSFYSIFLVLILVQSCSIKEKIDHNSFHGVWESTILKIDHYDETGTFSHTEEVSINARLGFSQDRFNQYGVSDIPMYGTYLGVKTGKKPVLYFSESLDGMTPDIVGTVLKKTRKNMEVAFYDISAEGYIISKRTYVFKFLKKIKSEGTIDLGNSEQSNIKIKYLEQGTQIEIPYYNHSYSLNTSTGFYDLKIEFFNNLSDNDYRYIEFVIRGNSSGIANGSFPFSSGDLTNSYGEFWFKRTGNGSMKAGISGSTMSCTFFDVSSDALSMSANCSQIEFLVNPTGMTDNQITNIVIGE